MDQIRTAVILVAGLGSRLKPLTDEVPKCLTEVNGKPILEQTLEALVRNGISKTVIVVGYLGQVVVQKIGTRLGSMEIEYLWNDIYDETNSMYSIWLAREYLQQGALLIEGDTVYEESIIRRVLQTPPDHTYWVVERFTDKFLGSMSTVDSDGRIVNVEIVRERLPEYRDNQFKSAGLLKITPEYAGLFTQWLEEDIKKGDVGIYYDLVIAKHLQEAPIYIYDITGSKWFEIDNLDDLRLAEAEFSLTKYIIVVVDGAADLPIKALGDKTVFEAARLPATDRLAKGGATGLMRTMYPGLPIGSIVAIMGLLGYNPARYYPNGRASFEALAQNIFLEDGDIAFRCNLISLDGDCIRDFTASNISNQQARGIIEHLSIDNRFVLHSGQSYRNLLVVKEAPCSVREIVASEPHSNIGKPVRELLLEARTAEAQPVVDELNQLMLASIEQIRELNRTRQTPADMVFLWSPSSAPWMPAFHRKYGINGAIICGLDFLRGIAYAAGLHAQKVPGATGYSDTDLGVKLEYAKNALRYHDLVMVHVNAPDEESHNRDPHAKVEILERIDREIVQPLVSYLDDKFAGNYRIALLPDHYTFCRDGQHSDKLVPYLVYGRGVKRDDVREFTEKAVMEKSTTIIKSYEFLDFFLVEVEK